ncbi:MULTISPECIES: CopG family transcriptional regulator [unclassified Thioalkalivibrio]|uniref:ribbon-helix-helix domain-containing protein n=1 Tax=unclassified Thioalkalivibrio TaxID=2621013 RepID=UPI00036D4AA2|nr:MULTISPECIES: CopG family transcriptional regulator [unclassified Thioalkalivibrio]
MRTIVDIPEQELRAIKALARREKISQTEAIRRAVRSYLKDHPPPGQDAPAFGIWGQRQDGVEYQEARRDEWSR